MTKGGREFPSAPEESSYSKVVVYPYTGITARCAVEKGGWRYQDPIGVETIPLKGNDFFWLLVDKALRNKRAQGNINGGLFTSFERPVIKPSGEEILESVSVQVCLEGSCLDQEAQRQIAERKELPAK